MPYQDAGACDTPLESTMGRRDWIDDLRAINGDVAEGLTRLTTVTTREGALHPSIKLLYSSSIAVLKNEDDLAATLMSRAIELGLTAREAHGAATTLLVSRGVPALARFLMMLRNVGVHPEPSGREAREHLSERASIDYVEEIYGEVPVRVQLLMDHLPGALEGFSRLRSAGLRDNGLSPKHTELLLVAINSSLYEFEFVEAHVRDARDEGATDTELAEAVATAIPLGGMAAWGVGAAAIESSRTLGSRGGPDRPPSVDADDPVPRRRDREEAGDPMPVRREPGR